MHRLNPTGSRLGAVCRRSAPPGMRSAVLVIGSLAAIVTHRFLSRCRVASVREFARIPSAKPCARPARNGWSSAQMVRAPLFQLGRSAPGEPRTSAWRRVARRTAPACRCRHSAGICGRSCRRSNAPHPGTPLLKLRPVRYQEQGRWNCRDLQLRASVWRRRWRGHQPRW